LTKFIYYESELFKRNIKKIEKRDPVGFKHIKTVIDRLCNNPEKNDGPMVGNNKGKFKKYVGRSSYRLIFCWCEICHKYKFESLNNCDKCGELPGNTIIFFDIFRKSDHKKLGY